MKLSNQQINAIVNEASDSAQKKLDGDHKKKLASSIKDKSTIAKKYYKMYMALPDELRKFISPYDRVTEGGILNHISKVEKKRFDCDALRNQIILASIDSKDLEELKKKLKLQF